MRDPGVSLAVANCRPFTELPPETVHEIVARMRQRSWKAGDTIIRQGEPGDWLMVMLEGRASAWVHRQFGAVTSVAAFGPSDLVGEMAILARGARTADVVADSDVRGLVLSSPDFDELAALHPELGMVLTHLVADRLGQGDIDGMAGKTVGGFRIVRCVGRGATSVVYEAVEEASGDRVALKMMSHRLIYERGALARFHREADILQSLSHANIARVMRRFSAFRTYFIALEFCDGATLSDLVSNGKRLGEPEVKAGLGQIASALHCLHERGVIHRDLKPANALVTSGGVVKLIDFGLARPTVGDGITTVTDARTVLGTPYYMAPEVLGGDDASPASDVYSLGCVALEMLDGRAPFQQRSFSELVEAKRSFAPDDAALARVADPELRAYLSRSLAFAPSDRTVDLAEVSRWAAPIPAA